MKATPEGIIPRPPLGLQPRWSIELNRAENILGAIERYAGVEELFPEEWVTELEEIMASRHLKAGDRQILYKRTAEIWDNSSLKVHMVPKFLL